MGLLSEIHQISKYGSRDQLKSLLATSTNHADESNSIYERRQALSKYHHNVEVSLASAAPLVRTY